MNPTVGRIVHYVSYGTPSGEYAAQCRAAIVTGVDPEDTWTADLMVANPTGLFFNRSAHHSGDPAESAAGAHCAGGDRAYPGGTWHWPEIKHEASEVRA